MNAAGVISLMLLTFGAGFSTPYVKFWVDWQRSKPKAPNK